MIPMVYIGIKPELDFKIIHTRSKEWLWMYGVTFWNEKEKIFSSG